ncbi:MAG TPA: hypothetical protein VFV82_08650, partial [Candidatus Binatia bacterium]|nr:hypothetical protein [Candidatus Binatia bacterium]
TTTRRENDLPVGHVLVFQGDTATGVLIRSLYLARRALDGSPTIRIALAKIHFSCSCAIRTTL